jgi:hypothetical protein
VSRLRYLRTIGPGELTAGRLGDAIARRLRDVPHRLAWELPTAASRRNARRLTDWHGIHTGQRCVIAANGPSLRSMDLTLLRGVPTFGMNRIYRLEATHGFRPSYLVVMDLDVQLEQISGELAQVRIPKFLNWNARALVREVPDVTFIKETFRPRFSTNLRRGAWGGHSVTYVCLQLAYWMGFHEVILIGKDHNYAQSGVPGQLVVAQGGESNHAIPGYYAAGQAWRIPDYKGEELAYRMARTAFERAGRQVIDATVGGKLDVFAKADYRTLFSRTLSAPGHDADV